MDRSGSQSQLRECWDLGLCVRMCVPAQCGLAEHGAVTGVTNGCQIWDKSCGRGRKRCQFLLYRLFLLLGFLFFVSIFQSAGWLVFLLLECVIVLCTCTHMRRRKKPRRKTWHIIYYYYCYYYYFNKILRTFESIIVIIRTATCSCRSLSLFTTQTKRFFSIHVSTRHWYNMLFFFSILCFSLCCFFAQIMLKNMLFALHYAKLF